jgi:hypothetical protein
MAEYIGRYRAERIVGSGAFGSVWLALDEALGAWVAIKILSEGWAHDEEIRRRFMEEARILWRADSEHIVRIHNVDQLPDGRPYFVMDYADRGTLEQRMQHRAAHGQPWAVAEAIEIGLAIADGLKVAHALGIVHRDLKPANVMYQSIPVHRGDTRAERLILTDFGIARSLAASRGHTISAGTPDYMAPEQVEGRADARSDVYAASALLYELLAGEVPHPHASMRDVVVQATQGREAPLITSVRPDVPRELALVVHRGLALDAERRWPTAAAWAGALSGAKAHAAAAAIPTELSGQQPQVAAPPPEAAQPAYAAAAPPPAGAQPPQQPPGAWQGQQPGQPGHGQPPQPPPGAPPGGPGGGGRKWWKIVVPIVAAIAIAGGAVGAWLALGGEEEAEAATSLVLAPAASVGQDPFTESVVPDEEEEVELPAGADLPQEILDRLGGSIEDADPDAIAALIEELLAGLNPTGGDATDFDLPDLDLPPGGRVSGAAPGLYGGTQLLSVCDRRLLVDFLLANSDKARAWAGVQGIPVGDIEAYVGGLTDVILQADTRVTNHGFSGGAATTIDTVLQAGTAVLVDSYGVPRVRCYCGNPLTPPRGLRGTPTYIGNPWPGFVLEQTIIIEQVTIIDEFSIDDVITDDFIFRDPGTPPEDATLTSATEEPTQTIEPPETEPPAQTEPPETEPPATTEAPETTDITSQGNVNATSEFSSEFPASLAIDGDPTTSWFSAGSDSDGATSTFAWGPADQSSLFIESITVVSNADHANPDFRTGFGFSEVQIQVVGADGVVWEEVVSLDGTPDPTITVEPGVVGNAILLHFGGHEASNCGGFAELIVVGGPA